MSICRVNKCFMAYVCFTIHCFTCTLRITHILSWLYNIILAYCLTPTLTLKVTQGGVESRTSTRDTVNASHWTGPTVFLGDSCCVTLHLACFCPGLFRFPLPIFILTLLYSRHRPMANMVALTRHNADCFFVYILLANPGTCRRSSLTL
jgi:hypothetical protein